MEATIPLAALQRCRPPLQVHEAVAIAQILLTGKPYGPLSLESVRIGADGSVHCQGTAATPGPADVAILLQSMLALSGGRVPSGLRYALARALHDVEAPPFESGAELAGALARFETRPDCGAVIAAIYQRAANAPLANAHPDLTPPAVERRRRGVAYTDMRRQLQEADQRIYEAEHRPTRSGRPDTLALLRKPTPIFACMIAGVALVAAGEVASLDRNAPESRGTERRLTTDVHLRESAAPPAAAAVDGASPIRQTEGIVPTVTTGTAVSPAGPARRVRPMRRAPGVMAGNRGVPQTATQRRATRASPAVKAAPRKGDEQRGLRIRFVWDNPFR